VPSHTIDIIQYYIFKIYKGFISAIYSSAQKRRQKSLIVFSFEVVFQVFERSRGVYDSALYTSTFTYLLTGTYLLTYNISDIMKVVWQIVPGSRSSRVEDMLSELSSYARLCTVSCVDRSESRSTAGL